MAEAQLIAGFDAGQTHTTCRLAWLQADGSSHALADGDGSGVSHLSAGAGEQRFCNALRSSLAAARQAAGVAEAIPLLAAAIGASGIEQGTPLQAQGRSLASSALGLPPEHLLVTGDEHTALRGAFHDGSGILVISGTGCIALGRRRDGLSHRCGGWGWLLDGAGSAMDIGRDGLALSVQMADGRLQETSLRQQLWQALGATTAQAVKAAVVAPGFAPAGFARLAPVLDQLAGAGDPHAAVVLMRSAEALAAMVDGVAQALDWPEPAVCGVGGALRHLPELQQRFHTALVARLPGARLQEPAGDACCGALLMAAALLGGRRSAQAAAEHS